MNVYEAVMNRRTVRKYTEKPVPAELLMKIVNCGRMSASAANLQPIKYFIARDKEMTDRIFPLTKWGGYLKNGTPSESERPTAYIAVIGDSSINAKALENEAGLVMTSIMLAAEAEGIGTCCLGAIIRSELDKIFGLSENLHTLYLIAAGYPAQNNSVCDMVNGDCKYFESDGGIVVPKRPIDEVVINFNEINA